MDPVTDSAGRVTRSLRKRIPSVDSENSSRPGTPVPSKLTAITEISSPSRPTRITRRSSISGVATPSKTPAKRVGATTSVISETTESVTPARRSTRRQSVSINESEGTPQADLKAQAFVTLVEQVPTNIKQTVVKLMRLQTQSPEQKETLNSPDDKLVKTNPKSSEQIKSTGKINIKTEAVTPEKIKSTKEIMKTNAPVEKQLKTESKSPQQSRPYSSEEIKSLKPKVQQRQKFGPKCNIRLLTNEMEDLSDVEVIALEKESINENKMKTNNLTTINLIDDEYDNVPQQINNDNLADKSSKQIKDIVTSTQSPQSSLNENKANDKIDHNTTIIDLMECNDGQQIDNTDKLPAEEEIPKTINLPESCTTDSEISKISVEINNEITQNTENVNEESTTNINIESKTEAINEEMSIELKPLETESSVVINKTYLNESKSEKNSTGGNLENMKPQDTSQIEYSVIKNEICPNESKFKQICTEVTLENKKPQETLQIECAVIINETLNGSKAEENLAKDILENNMQEDNKSQAIIEINDETIDSSKSDLNSGDLDCTSTQADEIIPSITINDDSRNGSKLDVEENNKICTTPQPPKQKSTIIEVINVTPTQFKSNASGCKSSKKVEFDSSPSGDNLIKSVYPRTPAFMKTKSFIEVDSTPIVKQSSNEETVNSLMLNMNEIGETYEKTQEHQQDNERTISLCEETNEMEVDKNKIVQDRKQTIINCGTGTPPQIVKIVQQLKISQSSTPIIDDASKTKDDDLHQLSDNEVKQHSISLLKESIMVKYPDEKLDAPESLDCKLENINIESISIERNETELKWINPCVKGNTTEGGKLDAVAIPKEIPEKPIVDKEHEIEEEHKCQTRRVNAIIFSSGSEAEEEIMSKDDDEEEELAAGEKPYKRKHVFHDEATEVEDYESGDSMDSEERREMLENEVPVDGESIGSNTTDEEHDDIAEECEESENDSFIVSDNEEGENFQLECSEDSNDDDDFVDDKHDRKKEKIYKRIQRLNETTSSSSSDEFEEEKEEEDENDTDKKIQSNTVNSPTKNVNNSIIKSSDNNFLDSSNLSVTALCLQSTGEIDSEEQTDEQNENISRKEILRKLYQSDRFNKSVRDLNPEVETSPIEHNNGTQTESNFTNIRDNKIDLQKSISLEKSMITEENEERSKSENDDKKQQEEEKKSCTDEDSTSSNSSYETIVVNKISKEKQAELSHLGEVSVTTESDNDKETAKNDKLSSNRSRLSVSFDNITKPKKQSTQRRSFTIGVSLKRGDLEAAIKATKKVDSPSTPTSSLPSPPSANAKQDDELSSDDTRYLENIKHMPLPLGNPLVRTRRQSLALPTNPDMEICSSNHGVTGGSAINKKTKRKSLGILSGNEFNPSQSFIDSMELRKNEFDHQAAKRKRLSKSFCGAADTKDNSIIDIDVRHLHKRSKLSAENSIIIENYDSMENINSSKLSTKATISSTPREKTINNDSNKNVQRILNRCEEILDAANHAKLQAKLKNKKIKAKAPKKNRKKTPQQSIRELNQDSDAKRKLITKNNDNEEKTKAALAQALKAADIIIGKKKQRVFPTVKQDSEDSKRLSSHILKAINKSENIMKKKKKRDGHTSENKNLNYHTTSTATGNFIDMPQTPEKKKKKVKIIQLPTGKVCVEPITPKHRPVLACNGTVFRESPITPLTVGFNVSHVPCDGYRASILKDRKRKRNFDDFTRRTLPKPQWTQSGLFIEEEIPTMRRIASSEVSQFSGSFRLNKHQTENYQYNAHWNFKENAIMRHDIKRSTNREILQLKERRQIQSQF